MSWKRLDVGPDAADVLKTSFETAFARSGKPRNAALFEVAAGEGVQLYFSPGGAELFETTLKTMTKKNAGAPPPEARLVVGDPATWSRA